jgi:hypothetical protein
MTDYVVANLDEIDALDYRECRLLRVRHHLGITAFGVNAWTAHAAGDRLVPEHEEDDGGSAEELYVVQRGRAVFELDGERHDAPAGTLVLARQGVTRTAFAEEPGTTIVVVGATPGKAYEPHGWEVWATLAPLYDAGDYEAVVAQRQVIEAGPYALLRYNLACCESLTGRTVDALEHLRQAIEMSERFRAYAKGDSDFDAIRDEPAFVALVGG